MDEVFIFGNTTFSEWKLQNAQVKHLVLSGVATLDNIQDFMPVFSYKNYERICFKNFSVNDVVYENGYKCSYEDHLKGYVYCNGEPFSVFEKLYLNYRQYGLTEYLIENDNIYSLDGRTLIHTKCSESIVIPIGVRQLGIGFCSGYENLLNVTFCSSLECIGAYAFSSTGLINLQLPNSVREIGEHAFDYVPLEKICLSNKLQVIPECCFTCHRIDHIIIPSSVRCIEYDAFRGWFDDQIVIPEGVERIDSGAFQCLLSIELPSTLKSLASDFYYESGIDRPDFPPYVKISVDNPFFYAQNGSLFFKENGKCALDALYNGKRHMC